MEIWTAKSASHRDHSAPPGPWSGHTQVTAGDARLTIDGARFTLAFVYRNTHEASNRGSDATDAYEFAGDVEVQPDGYRLLRATHRIAERHEYHEPMEDMWTPPIDRSSAFAEEPLRNGFVLRVAGADAPSLRLEEMTSMRLPRSSDAVLEWLMSLRLYPAS